MGGIPCIGYYPPWEAYRVYREVYPTQGGIPGYTGRYIPPREAMLGIHHCYIHPGRLCWVYTTLYT